MGFFRRQARDQEPLAMRDLAGAMARFGRFEFDPQAGNEDPSWVYENIIAPLYPAASADPATFVELLEREISVAGGWAAYGAGHAVWELLTSDQRLNLKGNRAYNAVVDASLEFLRQTESLLRG